MYKCMLFNYNRSKHKTTYKDGKNEHTKSSREQ